MILFRRRTKTVAWVLALVMILGLTFSPSMTGTASAAGVTDQLKDVYEHLDDNNIAALQTAQQAAKSLSGSDWETIVQLLMTNEAKKKYIHFVQYGIYPDEAAAIAALEDDLVYLLTAYIDNIDLLNPSRADIDAILNDQRNQETIGQLFFEPDPADPGKIPAMDKNKVADFMSAVANEFVEIAKANASDFAILPDEKILESIPVYLKKALYEAGQGNEIAQNLINLEWITNSADYDPSGDMLVNAVQELFNAVDANGQARMAMVLGAIRSKISAPTGVVANIYPAPEKDSDHNGSLITGYTNYNIGDSIKYGLNPIDSQDTTSLVNWEVWHNDSNVVSIEYTNPEGYLILTAANPGEALVVAYRKAPGAASEKDWLYIFRVIVASPADAHKLTFEVKDSETDATIQGAAVSLDGITLFTDASGLVTFVRQDGDYSYDIEKMHYIPIKGADVTLGHGNLTVGEALDPIHYDITFTVQNRVNKAAIAGAAVTVGTESKTTDSSGKAVFDRTFANGTTYSYNVSASGYISASGNFIADGTKNIPVDLTASSSSGSGGGGGTTTTEKVTKSITAASGGSISLGEITVTIPGGGLAGDANVTITKLASTANLLLSTGQKLLSGAYEVTKDKAGNLQKSATVSMNFSKGSLDPDQYKIELCYYDAATKTWVPLADQNLDWDKGVITGATDVLEYIYAVVATPLSGDVTPPPDDEGSTPVPGTTLTDIAGHWAYSSIMTLLNAGIISGYPDGTFKPDNNISRAEFTVMVVKAFNLSTVGGKVFADTDNHWAKEYIATANGHGIVSGYSDTKFGPDDPVTREQMAVMVAKAKNLASATSKTYTDAAMIASWAKESVDSCTAAGIFVGYPDGSFKPQWNATRAEAAMVIANAIK